MRRARRPQGFGGIGPLAVNPPGFEMENGRMNFFASRTALATLLASTLTACAPSDHPLIPVPARTSPPIAALQIDVDLPTGASVSLPENWTRTDREGALVITSPEGSTRIAFLDGGSTDAAAALGRARAFLPTGAELTSVGAQRPARGGWDEAVRHDFDAVAGEGRSARAYLYRKADRWTVMIADLDLVVAERRENQIGVVFNSLEAPGYSRESFAGRTAATLDVAKLEELSAFIESAQTAYGIPGVAVGIIQDGRVIFARGFGERAIGDGIPVDADTQFNIASNGKAFTTLMLARLVDEGRLTWDTRVVDVWPEFRLGDPETTRLVRIRHLVCACTGMPRRDEEWIFEGENQSTEDVMAILAESQPTSAFGESYQYSNLMAAAAGFLVGHMVEPDADPARAYDRALKSMVLDPLGMVRTEPVLSGELGPNTAAGHDMDVFGTIRVADQGWNVTGASTRPSGNHWASLNDMLAYVRFELSEGLLPDGRRLLGREALLERREPQVVEDRDEWYAMGLKIDRQWGVELVRHGGSASGYLTDMIWLPEHGVGAVILINSSTGGMLRATFRRRLLELLFGGEPLAISDLMAFAGEDERSMAAYREQVALPADAAAAAVLSPRYVSPLLGELRVTRESGATWFDFGAWKSEVASSVDEEGRTVFTTISPGVQGYSFVVSWEDGRAALNLIGSAQSHGFVAEP